ncbi:MAG: helix-hairpin-helix domain-containing protein [Oscillibacter sp.]|nr:helix-hairpin-helix domain-containing protein [Oscillibacter sp.]
MKKKQKINKAVNHGELVLLGLTALFLCVLFVLRDRPAAVLALPQPRAAPANPDTAPANSESAPDGAPVATSPVAADSTPATPAPDTAGRVNINTADLAALCALPGIGEALAGRVIEYREAHGPFASPDEIMNVSGIGAGKFAAIEALITTE